MTAPLRVLLVEDDADDAELITRCLRKAGHEVIAERVDCARGFVERLEQRWDVVISDHVVPGFGSRAALQLLRARNLDLPFIVVSGLIGEEAAVEALKAGADDYVMKDRLARLPPAVARAIAHRGLERRQRQHEDEAHRAQTMEALGTLAAGIAHDVNNILTAILLNAQVAQSLVAGHRADEHLEQVCLAAERGRELVQRTLAFGRPAEGRRALVDTSQVVEEVAALLRPGLPDGVDLRIDTGTDVPPVFADPTQLFQVVMNLASNAVQAIESGSGSVTLGLAGATLSESHHPVTSLPAGKYLRLQIVDTGKGMDASTAARVFEPFFTTRPRGQGTGLGLAAVHQLVRHHGGSVSVETEVGRGATFTVFLPAAVEAHVVEAHAVVPAPERTPPAAGGRSGIRHVLYVEDETLIAIATARHLRSAGYAVTDVRTGREALDAVRADPHRFDMLLTDHHLPGMSGLELARALVPLRPDLPVVITSGVTSGDRALALSNVQHWLAKPYTDQALEKAVARALGNARPQTTMV